MGDVGPSRFPLGEETSFETSQEKDLDEFPEVPVGFIGDDWVWACSDRWKAREPMPVLEARAALWGLKHMVRSSSCHGKKLVVPCGCHGRGATLHQGAVVFEPREPPVQAVDQYMFGGQCLPPCPLDSEREEPCGRSFKSS